MCAKLKCCLNYEVDNYVEASRKMPPKDAVLQTADGEFHQFKVDILAGLITYSSDKNLASNLETITAARAKEIIEMNRKGEKPLSLLENGKIKESSKPIDLLNESDLSRFDKSKKKKKKNNKNRNRQDADNKANKQQNENRQQQNGQQAEKQQQGENRQQQNGQQGENRQQQNGQQGENRQQQNEQQRENRQGNRHQNGNNNRRRDNHNRQPRQQHGGDKKPEDK